MPGFRRPSIYKIPIVATRVTIYPHNYRMHIALCICIYEGKLAIYIPIQGITIR